MAIKKSSPLDYIKDLAGVAWSFLLADKVRLLGLVGALLAGIAAVAGGCRAKEIQTELTTQKAERAEVEKQLTTEARGKMQLETKVAQAVSETHQLQAQLRDEKTRNETMEAQLNQERSRKHLKEPVLLANGTVAFREVDESGSTSTSTKRATVDQRELSTAEVLELNSLRAKLEGQTEELQAWEMRAEDRERMLKDSLENTRRLEVSSKKPVAFTQLSLDLAWVDTDAKKLKLGAGWCPPAGLERLGLELAPLGFLDLSSADRQDTGTFLKALTPRLVMGWDLR